jgi:tight adherence protein C
MSEQLPRLIDLFAALCCAAGAICALVAWQRTRIKQMIAVAKIVAGGGEIATPRGPLRALVGPLAGAMRPHAQIDLEKITTRLSNAGRRGRDEVDRFLEEKVLWMLTGLAGAIAALAFVPGVPGLLLGMSSALWGIIAADRLLQARVDERQGAVRRGLPSAVDLLVTCLDAGLSLEQAVTRVAKDLAHSEPILAEELRLTASELEAGVTLADALRRLSRRVGIDELSAMCGVVAQASALGAPIAQTLREYAIASRRQRISALEERAGLLSTKLTMPVALCLLPAALLVILGPAAVQLMKALQ